MSESIPDIVDKAKHSVLKVSHERGSGTGVIVDKRGLVVTNRHVVSLESFVELRDVDDRVFTGQVVLSDADVDYAFLLTPPWEIEPLRFRMMADVREGETVIAIGHPLGYSYSVSKGIVSSKTRHERNIDYIQTDTSINPGNSGGPLLDEEGNIIGINTWIRSDGQNLGFAIPTDYIKRAMARLNVDFKALETGYYCNICGFLNFKLLETPTQKYCSNCGTAAITKARPAEAPRTTQTGKGDGVVVHERVCSCCHTTSQGSSKYCPTCGATLK